MIDESVRAFLDTDPPVMETNATFSCLPGYVFRGPYMSTCMENGKWEPDPRKAECLGEVYCTCTYIIRISIRRGHNIITPIVSHTPCKVFNSLYIVTPTVMSIINFAGCLVTRALPL